MELLLNYLKVASRNLIYQKMHTGINVAGLSIGFAFSLLIFLFVAHELSYDKFHTKADQIYLLPMTWHFNETTMPTGANCSVGGPFMKDAFPEVEESVRISMSSQSFFKGTEAVKEANVFYADSAFLQVFSFPLLHGNSRAALTNPYSIVITTNMAAKYFGSDWQQHSIIGKTLNTTNNKIYQVTGVIENVPSNSHLQFDFVASFSTLPSSRITPNWDNSEFYTYVLLNKGADPKEIIGQTPGKLAAAFGEDTPSVIELGLVPMRDIYLHNSVYKVPNTSNVIYVRIFSLAAILVLLIATINYVNMATARSMERALEVGIRKVMGAQRFQLFYQFLGESLIITSFSLLLALTIAWLAIPYFNLFTEKVLRLQTLLTGTNLIFIIVSVLLISFLAGIYPALFISKYNPVKVLKGKLRDSAQGIKMRKALVVGQFLVSMVLIICTLMISSQINFIQSKNTGLNKEQLVSISLDSLSRTRLNNYKDMLASRTEIAGTSAAYQVPVNITHQTALSVKNDAEADRKLMTALSVDSDFINTVGLEVVAGNGFTKDVEHNSETWEILMNQSAAIFFGWSEEDAVGKELNVWQTTGTVKGVVKDFHFASLHNPIAPLIIFSGKGATRYSHLLVRVSGSPEETKSLLETSWKQVNSDSPFILTFLDDQYESLYKKESQLKNIVNIFAGLAIMISLLGLFGLASYTILQRTKELGIRKTLGASVHNLIQLVSGGFIRLILTSFILAIPVCWYLMDEWLNGFAYHIDFNWWIVLASGVTTLLFALLTVIYHALEVTRISPSETLRAQ